MLGQLVQQTFSIRRTSELRPSPPKPSECATYHTDSRCALYKLRARNPELSLGIVKNVNWEPTHCNGLKDSFLLFKLVAVSVCTVQINLLTRLKDSFRLLNLITNMHMHIIIPTAFCLIGLHGSDDHWEKQHAS